MEKRSFIIKTVIGLSLLGLMLVGCKKTTTEITTTTNDTSSQTSIAFDEVNDNDEMDGLVDDAIAVLSMSPTTSGGTSFYPTVLPGHPSPYIDTTYIASGIIRLTYGVGLTDSTWGISGPLVVVQLPMAGSKIVTWNTPGVKATITIAPTSGYEVYYTMINTIWYDGTINVTNVYGGLIQNLNNTDSVVEKVNGNLLYTANDNVAKINLYQWNICRIRTITLPTAGNITVTYRGDTALGSVQNVSDWGQTRENYNFYTTVTSPVIQDISVAPHYFPLHGSKYVQGIPEPMIINFGVDANGNPVGTGVPYGYKFNWSNPSGTQQAVVQYQY
jgi:hypothetical protein